MATPMTESYIENSGIDYTIAYLSNLVKDAVVYKTKYNAFNAGDSLYRENTKYYDDQSVVIQPITTTTLDKIFKNEKTFDFIKIDCQGSEIDIIKGGLEMCKRADVFLLEVSIYNYNLGAPMYIELKDFMSNIGFNYTKIVSNIYHPFETSILIQYDVLFTKRELT